MELLMDKELIVGFFWLILLFFITVFLFFIKEKFMVLYVLLSAILVFSFLYLFNDGNPKTHDITHIEENLKPDKNINSPTQAPETN